LSDRYTRPQIALHWLIVLFLIASYLTSDAMSDAYRAMMRGTVGFEPAIGAPIHLAAGMVIFALTLTRLALRALKGAPPVPDSGKPMMEHAARLAHWALYALLILLPVSGVMARFGKLREAGEAHEVMFSLLVGLIALHTVAALFHQYVLKDGLLLRMRPGR